MEEFGSPFLPSLGANMACNETLHAEAGEEVQAMSPHAAKRSRTIETSSI